MIIAGPCSYIDNSDEHEILKTAEALKGVSDYFRCKIFLGGTRPDRYVKGIEYEGIATLKKINDSIMPVMTEVQTNEHVEKCRSSIDSIWIGARNSQNYSLLGMVSQWDGDIFLKRGSSMTVEETCGIFDIMKVIHQKIPYVIERGINTFDRQHDSRWSPDLKGVVEIKIRRPDIFDNLVIDCSHSVGRSDYIKDVYNAFKAIGCRHFMFECTYSGQSKTDQGHMLSVDQLKKIL